MGVVFQLSNDSLLINKINTDPTKYENNYEKKRPRRTQLSAGTAQVEGKEVKGEDEHEGYCRNLVEKGQLVPKLIL